MKQWSDADFDKNMSEAKRPVLVDFFAPWCGPCQMMGPIFEKIAEEYGDKIDFVKVNVDENPITPSKFQVLAIPTLLVFNHQKIVAQKAGFIPKSELEKIIKEFV